MRRAPVAAVLVLLLACWLLAGSIGLSHAEGASRLEPTSSEVTFVALAPGATAGLNGTRATASVAGTLLATTTSLWRLDNVNATGTYVAKIDVASSSGVSNLVGLTIGIDNGTATPQVTASLGALTQTGGAYVTLPPGSGSTVYLTQSVSLLGPDSVLQLTLTLADDATERATTTMRANVTIT